MINNEVINGEDNSKDLDINKEERIKDKKLIMEHNVINEEDEFKPIIQKIFIKKSQKEKQKDRILRNINEEIEIEPSLKLPYMRLSKGKLDSFKFNTLLKLEPFFTEFNNNMEKKGEEIIKEISGDYKDEQFEKNKILFRYGDEADRFFIIKEGEVSLYFPFTEVINMNIDEYYIYILRLRRYNEIEMLNNVLLLNHGEFMVEFDEGFNMDEYLIKLYNTYLKLKFDPSFLYRDDITKKKKIKNIQKKDIKNNVKKNNNITNNNKKYYDDGQEFDNSKFQTFNQREIKELVLRIGEEILETMKWVMPENIYNIIEERKENKVRKRMINIHFKSLQKYKKLNPNIVNEKEYYLFK